jgi:putative drug exporter of the RND superfamily
VVRSLLVPALAYDIGARIWWPSLLAGTPGRHERTGRAGGASGAGRTGRAGGAGGTH